MNRAQTILTATFLLLALLAVPGTAAAQDDTMDQAGILDLFQPDGSTELQFQGNLALALNDDLPNFGVAVANYGKFITEHQEVGGRALLFVADDADGDIDFSGAAGPFYRYNFLTGEIAPYVGAAVTASFGDFTPGDVLLELEGGSRFFLDRNLAFTVAGTLNYDVDESELREVLNIFFGFSYFWQ